MAVQFQVFRVPIVGDSDCDELNRFLSTHRIVSVKREIVAGLDGCVVFVVEWLSKSIQTNATSVGKIDYRTALSPEHFRLFSKLRDLRKELAETDGVPVYAVFTNAQLAQIAERHVNSMPELAGIDGIGTGRVEKYGERICNLMQFELRPAIPDRTDEGFQLN